MVCSYRQNWMNAFCIQCRQTHNAQIHKHTHTNWIGTLGIESSFQCGRISTQQNSRKVCLLVLPELSVFISYLKILRAHNTHWPFHYAYIHIWSKHPAGLGMCIYKKNTRFCNEINKKNCIDILYQPTVCASMEKQNFNREWTRTARVRGEWMKSFAYFSSIVICMHTFNDWRSDCVCGNGWWI